MVRSIVADAHLQEYILKLAAPDTCTLGLILGQPTPGKDYVIHFAKTPPLEPEEKDGATKSLKPPLKNISDVADFWVADHAKHATRMLPGGMYVLGIFVVSEENIFSSNEKKLKSIMIKMQAQLVANALLHASGNQEKIVLNYCTKRNDFICQSYDTVTGVLGSADFKFLPSATKWHQLECRYELQQIFPIPLKQSDWALKKHIQVIIEGTNQTLKSAVFLFDGEIKNGEESLESMGKKKKSTKGKQTKSEDVISTQVSIYVPSDSTDNTKDIEIRSSGGHIKITGQVGCKLWLHPKSTLAYAKECVTQDLIRSLAARLEMHWDSLIEEEHGNPEDTNSFHEPPRRVIVPLPTSIVTLSDYLFPGEGHSEAMISLQDLLDIQVSSKTDITELEGQADLNELYPPPKLREVESEENLPQLPQDGNRFIYLVGLGVALLILIISLVINYMQNNR